MVSVSLAHQLYTVGSLRNGENGPSFRLKNRLFEATLTAVGHVSIDGVPFELTTGEIVTSDGAQQLASITAQDPLVFPVRAELEIRLTGQSLSEGAHTVSAEFVCEPFGLLGYQVVDYVVQPSPDRPRIPRLSEDWSEEAVKKRKEFVHDVTGVRLDHVAFAPDGATLATGGREGAVRVWDVATGAEVSVLRGHTGGTTGVAFSPDGRTLLSVGFNGAARWWSAPRA